MTKKKKIVGVAGLAAVALIGGTFAYFSQSTTIDNPFDTAKYGTIVTEEFNPEDGEKWEPGVTVNKDVEVENTGDRDVVVRVKLEDIWKREGSDTPFKTVKDKDIYKTIWADQDEKNRQPGDTLDDQDNAITWDGTVTGDRTVVDKTIINYGTDWKYAEEEENGETVAYFYYTKKLAPGTNAVKFLDDVTLNKNTDMGKFKTTYYFAIAEQKPTPFKDAEGNVNKDWQEVTSPELDPDASPTETRWQARNIQELMDLKVDAVTEYITGLPDGVVIEPEEGNPEKDEYKLNPDSNYSIYTAAVTEPVDNAFGYSGANYTLRITVETVQATSEAVKSMWEHAPDDIVAGWQLNQENLEPEEEEETP